MSGAAVQPDSALDAYRAELAAWGIDDPDAADFAGVHRADVLPTGDYWPEHEAPLRLFLAMRTQWRTAGMAGVLTGLDYAALPVAADCAGIGRKALREHSGALQAMEAEALQWAAEQARA
jgi:hypothetical protein